MKKKADEKQRPNRYKMWFKTNVNAFARHSVHERHPKVTLCTKHITISEHTNLERSQVDVFACCTCCSVQCVWISLIQLNRIKPLIYLQPFIKFIYKLSVVFVFFTIFHLCDKIIIFHSMEKTRQFSHKSYHFLFHLVDQIKSEFKFVTTKMI